MELSPRTQSIIHICGTVLLIEGVLFAGYRYWALFEEHRALKAKSRGLEISLYATEQALFYLHRKNTGLTEGLVAAEHKNQQLGQQVTGLSGAVGELSSTVGTLQKLNALDPELLNKYSKVYFLSENYIPPKLAGIDPAYLAETTTDEYLQPPALPFLHRMLSAARADDVTIQVVSAYRSFDEQKALKSGYQVVYGSGANQFSADQGYSEHQLGTTCDFTTPGAGGLSLKLESTPAYKWLTAHAHKFGFILSYPKGNAYYKFEPWHWRFVGVGLATVLHDQGKYFYELAQREIDPYLIAIFD